MIREDELIHILDKYKINSKRLIKNNPNILKYGIYNEIEDIIIFLQSMGFKSKNIEKCPSILFMSNLDNIKVVYGYLINNTKLEHIDIENCLSILSSDPKEVEDIYWFVLNKYGINILKQCPSILSGNYNNIIDLTNTLEKTIGIDIIKNNGGSILIRTTSKEFIKILKIPEFNYNKVNKSYNKNLLTSSTFQRTYDEIIDIFKLKYWKDDKFKHLLTASIWDKIANQIECILELDYWKDDKFKLLLTPSLWLKDVNQIKDILELDYWKDDRFIPLLTPTIWHKNADQIKDILDLKHWGNDLFNPLLTPNIWNKDANQINDILQLDYWRDNKFKPLLTPSLWNKDANQIKDILELDYWKDNKFIPLLTPNIWNKDVNQIKDILELDYWKDDKFIPLLTPNVWNKDANQIKDILELDYWKDDKFKSLLTPTIWRKNADQIKINIDICLNNGLELFANNPILIYRCTTNELIAKINYLNYHKEPLYETLKNSKLKINSIFGMSNKNMQKKYGISKEYLIKNYLNIEVKDNVL